MLPEAPAGKIRTEYPGPSTSLRASVRAHRQRKRDLSDRYGIDFEEPTRASPTAVDRYLFDLLLLSVDQPGTSRLGLGPATVRLDRVVWITI